MDIKHSKKIVKQSKAPLFRLLSLKTIQKYRDIATNKIATIAQLMRECIKDPEACKKEQCGYNEYQDFPGYKESWGLFDAKVEQARQED
jgi:hypothetical protein